MEQKNKSKTYIVIIAFVIIILLSSYVVINKIIDRNKEKEEIEEIIKDEYINEIKEVSLSNDIVKKIYSYTEDDIIEYYLYLNKNKNLTWDSKSLLVAYNLNKDDYKYGIDILNVDRDKFEKTYTELFENHLNKESKSSKNCPTTTYNIDEDMYTINLSCYKTDKDLVYKTFLKNITLINDDIIRINKYYVFILKNETNYTLYKKNDMKDTNKIVENINFDELNKYIYDMDVITYEYKKVNGKYYFSSVK